MSYPVYYVEAGDTLPILFDTFDGGTGASITMTGLAVTDIEVYKDGGATQRASDAGYTLLDTDGIDFDSLTGIHGFSLDLSNNTDAGFYAVGSWYHVVVSSITVDAQTVSFVAAAFRIVSATRGLAGTALPDAAADAAGGLPISDAGGLDLDTQIGTDIDAILVDTGTTLDGKLDTIDGIVDAILVDTGTTLDGKLDTITADTDEIQAELADGGRTDLLIDAILADTAVIGAPAGASVSADIAAVKSDSAAILIDTAEIGAAGAGLTAVPWNAAWDAEVQSEVADGLAAYDPPTKAELDSGLAALNDPSAADVADAVWDEAIADHAGAGSTGAALAAATAPTAAAVADAVWDETIADHAGVGSTGAALAAAGGSGDPWATAIPGAYGAGTAGNILGNRLDMAVGDVPTAAENRAEMDSNSTQLAAIVADTAELQAELADGGRTDLLIDAILADTNELQTDNVPGLIAALNDPTAAAIADAIWDEAKVGHVGAGSFGEEVQAHSLSTEISALNNLSSADAQTAAAAALTSYDPPTKAELDSGLAALNDLDAAGVRTAVGLATANLDTQLGALPTAAENRMEMDANSTQLAAIVADTNELQTDDTPAALAALNNLSAAEVNAQVVDALATDVIADSVATDGSRPTIAQAVLMVLRFLTEKSVSGTTLTVKKEDGTTAAMTFTLDSETAPTSITRAS